VILIVTF